MQRRSSSAHPLGWLTIVGLACLASTAFLRRALRRDANLPDRIYRSDSDLEKSCYN